MAVLKAPKFVDQLPAAQRAGLAPRRAQLDQEVKRFVELLKPHRDKYAVAVEGVTATSTYYEAFRRAGCEVRVVATRDADGKPKVERKQNTKGVMTDYPICDIYVMLPAGEIVNRSGRKPWVAPAKRLEANRAELKRRDLTPERRKELEAEIAALLERNPALRTAS